MNLKIREMTATLKNYINSIELPPEVKRMVIKEIYDEAANKADEAIRTEIAEKEEASKGEKQDE